MFSYRALEVLFRYLSKSHEIIPRYTYLPTYPTDILHVWQFAILLSKGKLCVCVFACTEEFI